MIRLGINPYNSDNDTDDKLILENDLIEYRVIVQSSRLGLQGVNLFTLKAVVKIKKKILESRKVKGI